MDPISDRSDSEWRQALDADNPALLKGLFERYYPLMVGDIYRLIPDVDTCRDLAQEVFIELWSKRARLDIQGSFRAYLRKSAVNRALNHIKQQRRFSYEETEQDLQAADESSDDHAALLERDIAEDRLRRAIEALPEKTRIVFCLSRFERLSHKEIAERLGISTKTIENQITRAMRLLREALLRKDQLSSVVIWWFIYRLLE